MWFFTQSKHEEKTAQAPKKSATPPPAQYFALDPAFVVNLNGPVDGLRYLQLEVQLMTRDPAALEAIKTHAPAIRARLLMLFSQVSPDQIADVAGKEAAGRVAGRGAEGAAPRLAATAPTICCSPAS